MRLERFDHLPGVAHHDRQRGGRATPATPSTSWRRARFACAPQGPGARSPRDSVFVTTPGLEFLLRARRGASGGLLRLGVVLGPARTRRWRARARRSRREPRRCVHFTNRQAFLGRALRPLGAGRGGAHRGAGRGTAVLALGRARPARHPLFKPDRLAWHAARVDRAKALIEARYAEPLSLSAMARDAGMSMFHFARIFAELAGPATSSLPGRRAPREGPRPSPRRRRRHRHVLRRRLRLAEPLRHDVSPPIWRPDHRTSAGTGNRPLRPPTLTGVCGS